MIQTPDQFIKAYEKATARHDLEAIMSLIDAGAIYLFSDESVHVGREAIGQVIGRNFELIQDESYAMSNVTWLAESDEVAVCVFDFNWSGIINGAVASGSGRGTMVLRRSRKAWKVVHEHLSRGKFAA